MDINMHTKLQAQKYLDLKKIQKYQNVFFLKGLKYNIIHYSFRF
jgi:hypothetical protein